VRTPWKLLYDGMDRIMPYDSPTFTFFGGRLWLVCVAVVMIALTELASLLAGWLAPRSGLAKFLAADFWWIVLILVGVFFIYWFFRMVWDGIKGPTSDSTQKASH
jgi:uncharacterized membrane protein